MMAGIPGSLVVFPGRPHAIRCIEVEVQGIDFFVALVKEDVIGAALEADQTIAKF